MALVFQAWGLALRAMESTIFWDLLFGADKGCPSFEECNNFFPRCFLRAELPVQFACLYRLCLDCEGSHELGGLGNGVGTRGP